MRPRTYRDLSSDFPARSYHQIFYWIGLQPWRQHSHYGRVFMFLVVSVFLLSACQPSGETADNATQDKPEVLYLYNWSEAMPQQILDNFELETGISVISTTFDSNEEMYQYITQAHNHPPYDLIVPSNYLIDRMRHQGLLQPIDKTKITNFEQLDPVSVGTPADPNNDYSIPYLWGTTGIAINGQAIDPNSVNKWQDLWRPEFNGRLVLRNDMREVFSMALISLDHSVNSENLKEIKQAYNQLQLLVPRLSAFPSGSTRSAYVTDTADIGMIWSGEVILAQAEGKKDLVYKYPSEGAILWIDSFAIPKDAKNVEAAHLFINFILRPENSQIISRHMGYATPNLGARLFMTASTKANTILYPTPSQLKNAQLQTALSPKALAVYQYYWSKLNQQGKKSWPP